MNNIRVFAILGLVLSMAILPSARAQRPYIGFTYPAGGQVGTTFQIRVGGQGLDGVHDVYVSGTGVTAKILQYHWQIGPQDSQLLRQQLTELQRNKKPSVAETNLITKIEYRLRNYVQQPHNRSISSLAYIEVKIAPNAPAGEREIRLITTRGPSNPMPFHVGLVPEYTRKPMRTSERQLLGKENLALRTRPAAEAEDRINIPCAVNGQVASREVNSYRFTARKGQKLCITAYARRLVPYIADAVPGWFQPVLVLYDSSGKEVAYDDDYRFKPDPVILYDVPKDGEYVLAIYDAIYRGREDFVYRIDIGDLPFISSIFPLGGRVGEQVTVTIRGFNIPTDRFILNLATAKPGLYPFTLGNQQRQANHVFFMVDNLPECYEKEPDDDISRAQPVTLPIIINGRIDKTDDWDVFRFFGRAGESIVAEVYARRLDSPVDSVLKLTDAQGKLIAYNDDCEDLADGLNTHHADSYFLAKLPADGYYYVHIGDAARHGGDEYSYRLRISAPRPDFVLRAVPSSAGLVGKDSASVSIYSIRKDGYTGPIQIGLKDPPPGFTAQTAWLSNQNVTRFTFRGAPVTGKTLLNLHIEGRAQVGGREIVREVVPAEDRMQAFLWRHLVPANEFTVTAYPAGFQPPSKRVPPTSSATATKAAFKAPAKTTPAATVKTASTSTGSTTKFTKGQVAGRLRQLRRLYEDGLFTDAFYLDKVAECEAAQ